MERLPHPDPHRPDRRLYFKPAVLDALFCRLWSCSAAELPAHAWDRGFADLVALRAAVEPLAALLTLSGAPAFERIADYGVPRFGDFADVPGGPAAE